MFNTEPHMGNHEKVKREVEGVMARNNVNNIVATEIRKQTLELLMVDLSIVVHRALDQALQGDIISAQKRLHTAMYDGEEHAISDLVGQRALSRHLDEHKDNYLGI